MNSDKSFVLPNRTNVKVNDLIKILKNEQEVLIPVSANLFFNDENVTLKVIWSFVDIDNQESVKIVKYYNVLFKKDNRIEKIIEIPDLFELDNELLSINSDSGKYTIRFRKAIDKTGKTNQHIDIWSKNNKLKSLNLENLKQNKHGNVSFSSLCGFCFSPSEKKFAYIAEGKINKESFLKDFINLPESNNDDKSQNEKSIKEIGNEYEFRPIWGENLDISHTVICILTIEPEFRIKVIDIPKKSLSNPFWIDDNNIGFLAYEESPVQLGIVYCINRVNYIYKYNLRDDSFLNITGYQKELHLNSLRINKKRDKLFFLQNDAGGPHFQTVEIRIWDLKTNDIKTIYSDERQIKENQGLFIDDIKRNLWLSDDEHIVFHTIQKYKNVVIILNVNNGNKNVLDFGLKSATILNLVNDYLILEVSSFSEQPNVYISKLNFKTKIDDFTKIPLTTNLCKNIKFKVLEEIENLKNIFVIGLEENFETPQPTIAFLHGGPHSCFVIEYIRKLNYFAKLGFKLILINYRGSIGYDKEHVEKLCGNIGDYDVKDSMRAINLCIELGYCKKESISIYGGSHGGFIVTHLIGQYPDFGFKSCVAINPVVDLSKMIGVTDIPDWCLVEAFGVDIDIFRKLSKMDEEKSLVKILNYLNLGKADLLKEMFEKSPMNYIENVKTPVLMLLGNKDYRVPYYQGLSYYKGLQIRGVKSKCYVYEDSHSLEKQPHSIDYVLNTITWILDHYNN